MLTPDHAQGGLSPRDRARRGSRHWRQRFEAERQAIADTPLGRATERLFGLVVASLILGGGLIVVVLAADLLA